MQHGISEFIDIFDRIYFYKQNIENECDIMVKLMECCSFWPH